MAVYEGGRFIDGISVTVDGSPLAPCDEVQEFSSAGFEWTYEGDGPRQLALAVLIHHLGDANEALQLTEPFMKAFVANLDNSWRVTTADIEASLAAIDEQQADEI